MCFNRLSYDVWCRNFDSKFVGCRCWVILNDCCHGCHVNVPHWNRFVQHLIVFKGLWHCHPKCNMFVSPHKNNLECINILERFLWTYCLIWVDSNVISGIFKNELSWVGKYSMAINRTLSLSCCCPCPNETTHTADTVLSHECENGVHTHITPPRKFLGHLFQWELRGKHQIWNTISHQQNVIRWSNFAWLNVIRSFTR